MRVDLCKVPHHASAYNVNRALVAALDCRHWLISTSGARHRHPDRAAVARILARRDSPTLWFNYRGPTTDEFARASVTTRWDATTVRPEPGKEGLRVEVAAGHVHLGAAD